MTFEADLKSVHLFQLPPLALVQATIFAHLNIPSQRSTGCPYLPIGLYNLIFYVCIVLIKTKTMASGPIISRQIEGKRWK